MQSLDEKVWQAVQIGWTKPTEAPSNSDDAKIKATNFNSKALNALFSAVINEEFKKISSTKTAINVTFGWHSPFWAILCQAHICQDVDKLLVHMLDNMRENKFIKITIHTFMQIFYLIFKSCLLYPSIINILMYICRFDLLKKKIMIWSRCVHLLLSWF